MQPAHDFIPEPTEAEIQHEAYLLWVESGRLPGHDLENWFAARELLRHRHARAHPRPRHMTIRTPISSPKSGQPAGNN
jgi:hypothetical protein